MRRQFTGKERDDEADLEYFVARFYSRARGRFTSADPIFTTGERLLDPQRLNLYSYTRNSPTVFVDPDGKDVHITIGTVEVGKATIRVIGPRGAEPATMEVPLYEMVVTDDVTKTASRYLVTRDAPEIKKTGVGAAGTSKGQQGVGKVSVDVINTAFEPAEAVGVYVLVPVNKYPAGTDLEAYAVQNPDGTDSLAAEPNNSSQRANKKIATSVMIHVGGQFTR